ncbi:HEPN/Toprim-associated domain-containing protein [Arthrobacter sp. TMN-37]
MIGLALNDIPIHYGKNDHYVRHHWLFPPKSVSDVTYQYAYGKTDVKPGLRTSLQETYIRLCHLGYSGPETKAKFEDSVARWNRTAGLRLSFEDFHDVLTSIDFASLTQEDLLPYVYDFRELLIHRLGAWGDDYDDDDDDDSPYGRLEDFIKERLDFTLILRVIADRAENRELCLQWEYQDIIDSGWATYEDLTDIDRPTFIVNHTALYGRVQDYANLPGEAEFDAWLTDRGLPKSTPYQRVRGGKTSQQMRTRPTAVRNKIHHPENPHNRLTDEELHQSLEDLLSIAIDLPLGLT